MSKLRTINYRGGIACFNIPASWKEEYEESGGGTFYEDTPDSGTFRLSVLSLSSNKNESADAILSRLISESNYKSLRGDLAIKRSIKTSQEDGEQLQIHYWEVAIPVPPDRLRIAIFSYTVLASQAADRKTCAEIEMLESSILAADFSRQQGVSGDFHNE